MSAFECDGTQDTHVRRSRAYIPPRLLSRPEHGDDGATKKRRLVNDPRLPTTNPLFGYTASPAELAERLATENTRPHWSSDSIPARLPGPQA